MNAPINTDALVTELLNIQQNAVLSWDFTQSIVDIAPLHLIGAGGGAFGAVGVSTTNATTQVDTGHMNNGAANIFLYRRHPVSLPGGTTFSILLRFGSRAADVGTNATYRKSSSFRVLQKCDRDWVGLTEHLLIVEKLLGQVHHNALAPFS